MRYPVTLAVLILAAQAALAQSEAQELACWRLLPVVSTKKDAFRAELAKLKAKQPTSTWAPIMELIPLAGDADRAAFRTAALNLPKALPTQFPGAVDEQAHLRRANDRPRIDVGLEIVASRDFRPLHALRDLDRALTREAGFCKESERPNDADELLAVRDGLRQCYLSASRHLVERLFALKLTGDTRMRDALLAKAKAVPVLSDRAKLTAILNRMNEADAWKLVVAPLLASEVDFINQPPILASLESDRVAELEIRANKKSVNGGTVDYEGDVRVSLNSQIIACDRVSLVKGAKPETVLLTGEGSVRTLASNRQANWISADRFTFHAETGALSLGGNVLLREQGKLVKLRSCTITRDGDVLDARSWLDDFRNALTVESKRDLLKHIEGVYLDGELPDEVRFLLALERLNPHMNWRAPYLPPLPDRRELVDREKRRRFDDFFASPWQESLGGEPWMLREIPDKHVSAFRDELRSWYERYHAQVVKGNPDVKLPELAIPDRGFYFWRLRDPRHADVERCLRLLDSIRHNDFSGKAHRWAAEVRRNNTVLTFDIPAAAAAGKAHSILMDVRNAEQVAFKIYRVRRPEELLFATRNIGTDFIYRDHGLDDRGLEMAHERLIKSIERRAIKAKNDDGPAFKPSWSNEQLVHSWQVRVADLKHVRGGRHRWHRRWNRHDWQEEADAYYFDDECSEHRERLEKSYRPDESDQLSSWQCDRVVTIAEKVLKDAGAYVLVAEANGQVAQVPIVVDPVSLTMRRCRDGVFVLASDADGKKPLAGAQVFAQGIVGKAVADTEGAAFARVVARGDRAIVVHHEGRYAIGGFGEVFAGIYDAPEDWPLRAVDRLQRARKALTEEGDPSALVYADRHVIVAYTDRPTYRPGQEVKFKLIVRKLESENAAEGLSFRGGEFDATSKLTLPDVERPLRYAILDPKGQEVTSGVLTLNDFGTAAGAFKLNEETSLGAYSFRVTIAATPRLAPEVFAVKHYRRPNFEVKVTGVPEKLQDSDSLTIHVTSHYFFGAPVTTGRAQVRVVRKDASKSIDENDAALDGKGNAQVKLDLRQITSGKFFVITTVTDASGRTESVTREMIVERKDGMNGGSAFADLPRFIAVNEVRAIKTAAKSVRAEQQSGDVTSVATFTAKDGAVALKFSAPGWYRLKDGDDDANLFVFGGTEHPEHYRHERRNRDQRRKRADWVNLSDFAYEEHARPSRYENRSENLWALFDQQSLKVGDKLRLLVYVPHKDARVLFTFEGRTILDYVVMPLTGKTGPFHVVELPIKERYFPNVYVQGRIVPQAGNRVLQEAFKEVARKMEEERDEEDHDPRWCRIDVAKPASHLSREPLRVHVETDRTEYRPGDAVRATIKVTDHAGQPRAAELSLAAVDESVYTFGEDNLEGLPAFFHRPHEARRFLPKAWRTSVGRRSSDSQQRAIRELQQMAMEQAMAKASLESRQGESLPDLRDPHLTAMPLPRLGAEMPSAQIPLTRLREHFQETATWLPQLRTDEKGIARATFTLPDSLTRYRLTSIALTKTTEVGVGRARLTARLPLAVQLFLPRFAVEKDRMYAVALIHNHTNKPRECAFAWQIEGAASDGPLTGKIMAPAHGSAKVGVWLTCDKIGLARVTCRAADGDDSDAEVRTLPVQPLGKPAEINENQAIAPARVQPGEKQLLGKFTKDGVIKLPAGFVARELQLSLASSDVAQALDGLDYLVDYPHGCIEQTMSRFMPLVMVKHATQHSPVTLQPEIAKKMPEVLEKGLLRVYGHQHKDGSWGWFETDRRNLPMSIYVVYGLARCQATGTKVDAQVLDRGCDYLKSELRSNKDLFETSRAWLALALAGRVDTKALEALAFEEAKQIHADRPLVWCHLALACRAAGLQEAGERLWLKVHAHLRSSWWGHDTESFALILNTQLAFGAPYAECRVMANRLLEKRSGTSWQHTRDTAAALEALSNMLAYVQQKDTVRRLEVTLGGKTILNVRDAAERKKLVHRIHLKSKDVPSTEGLEIHLKSDADEPIHVSLRAIGVQRLDEIAATGARVKLTRHLETPDGTPLSGPLEVGQMVRVRLRLQLAQREDYLMIDERRPSLCEFVPNHIEGSGAEAMVHQDWYDDRLCVFFSSLPAGVHEIAYYMRAESAGRCTVLPGVAYPMYSDQHRGGTSALKLVVRDK